MCKYCEETYPITPSQWNPRRAGSDPGIIIEHTFNIDTGKSGVMCGYLIDRFDDLEPDAVFRFNYCPMCGRNLKGEDRDKQLSKVICDMWYWIRKSAYAEQGYITIHELKEYGQKFRELGVMVDD